MRKFRVSKIMLIFVIIATLVVGSSSISFAATTVSKVSYRGSGNVEVTFSKSTTYSNLKISVTDNKGSSYSTKVNSKSSKKLSFKIYSCKTGRRYKVKISGLKDGTATTSFQIISKKKAIAIAKKRAKKLGASVFSNVKAKSTTYRSTPVWKVTFESKGYKYTFHISQQTGFVLRWEKK